MAIQRAEGPAQESEMCRPRPLFVALLAVAMAAPDCRDNQAQPSESARPIQASPNRQPDLSRLASIERAVDWFIEAHRPEAEKLLVDLTKRIEAYAGLIDVPSEQALPRTTELLMLLSRSDLIVLRVMHPESPIVENGFAGMRLGNSIYVPSNLEDRATLDRLRAIVAHEVSHDRFDLVRKQLHRRIEGVTENELLWLDVRIEGRAHMGAMRRLRLAGLDPASVLEYVRDMNPAHFNADQMRYLQTAATGSLAEITLAAGMAERLR